MIESTFFTTTAGATTYGFNNYKIEISKKGSTPAAPAATPTPAPAAAPSPAPAATPSPAPAATPTPAPAATPTPATATTPSPAPAATPSPAPAATPSPAPSPAPAATPTPAPAATPTPAPATTPSPAPSATPAATPSAAPVAPAKQKPEEKYKSLFSTTVMSTTTSIVEGITRNNQIEHIYEKYASAYVESMSDQQLASAIERLDGIEYNFDEVEENNVITLKRV